MGGEITLTIKQIMNLCEFAGIAIDTEKLSFTTGSDELNTEFQIVQNEFGALAWLREYPEEGGYPLSGNPHCFTFLKNNYYLRKYKDE